MNGIRKAGQQLTLIAVAIGLFTFSSCSMRPALDKVYTSKDRGGAITQPTTGDATSSEMITTRGEWTCPTTSCEFRGLSSGAPFRSYAPQACPFCGTKLEKP